MSTEVRTSITKSDLEEILLNHGGNLDAELQKRGKNQGGRNTEIINSTQQTVKTLIRTIQRRIERLTEQGIVDQETQEEFCAEITRLVIDTGNTVQRIGGRRRQFITNLKKLITDELAIAQQEVQRKFRLPQKETPEPSNNTDIETILRNKGIDSKQKAAKNIAVNLLRRINDEHIDYFLIVLAEETAFKEKITAEEKEQIMAFLNQLFPLWETSLKINIESARNTDDIRTKILEILKEPIKKNDYPRLPEWLFRIAEEWLIKPLIEDVLTINIEDLIENGQEYKHAISESKIDDELRPQEERQNYPFSPAEIARLAELKKDVPENLINRATREKWSAALNQEFHGGINVRTASHIMRQISDEIDADLNLSLLPLKNEEREFLKVLIEEEKEEKDYDACIEFLKSSDGNAKIQEWTTEINKNYHTGPMVRSQKAVYKILIDIIIPEVYEDEDEDEDEDENSALSKEIQTLVTTARKMLEATEGQRGIPRKILEAFVKLFETYRRTANTTQLKVFTKMLTALFEKNHFKLAKRTDEVNNLEFRATSEELAEIFMEATEHLAIATTEATKGLEPIMEWLQTLEREIQTSEQEYAMLKQENAIEKTSTNENEAAALKQNIKRLTEENIAAKSALEKLIETLRITDSENDEWERIEEAIREKRNEIRTKKTSKEEQERKLAEKQAEVEKWTVKAERFIALEGVIQKLKTRKQTLIDNLLTTFRAVTAESSATM